MHMFATCMKRGPQADEVDWMRNVYLKRKTKTMLWVFVGPFNKSDLRFNNNNMFGYKLLMEVLEVRYRFVIVRTAQNYSGIINHLLPRYRISFLL